MTNVKDTVKVGRVFFEPESGPNVKNVTVLTLDSHVGNVVELVKRFDSNYFKVDHSETHNLLIRAAEKHDNAKPETFRVTYRSWKENGRKSIGYSFAGHRFRVSDTDRYVELLIRLHHEFSIDGIVEAQAQLKALEQYSNEQIKRFPIDLYVLEMCDQIEAELETYAFTKDVQPRVFMDFHSRMREDEKTIEVNPYPFDEKRIRLPLEYYEFDIPAKCRAQIAAALEENNREKGLDFLHKMIIDVNKNTECQKKEMILCQAP